nr:unnamed protein product [Digitaria exilis]
MASPTSSSTSAAPSFRCPVTEKQTRNNFHEWRAQVWFALREAQLAGYVDGTTPETKEGDAAGLSLNPEAAAVTPETKEGDAAGLSLNPAYVKWMVQDQQAMIAS